MKTLVYYVVGGVPEYSNLLRSSVTSLRHHHPPEDVDVAVLCDTNYAKCIADLSVRVCCTPTNKGNPVQASMRKMQVFQLVPDIEQYDVVLYLDCDTMVLGRLDDMLRAVSSPDKLYTCREEGAEGHKREFWSLGHYTDEQLAELENDNVGVFNCGQFAFRPTPTMAAHFAAVCRLIDEDVERRGFWEQAYANHHFNLSRAIDDTVLTPRVELGARLPPPPEKENVLIAHFSDASMPWRRKLQYMLAWVPDLVGHQG